MDGKEIIYCKGCNSLCVLSCPGDMRICDECLQQMKRTIDDEWMSAQ